MRIAGEDELVIDVRLEPRDLEAGAHERPGAHREDLDDRVLADGDPEIRGRREAGRVMPDEADRERLARREREWMMTLRLVTLDLAVDDDRTAVDDLAAGIDHGFLGIGEARVGHDLGGVGEVGRVGHDLDSVGEAGRVGGIGRVGEVLGVDEFAGVGHDHLGVRDRDARVDRARTDVVVEAGVDRAWFAAVDPAHRGVGLVRIVAPATAERTRADREPGERAGHGDHGRHDPVRACVTPSARGHCHLPPRHGASRELILPRLRNSGQTRLQGGSVSWRRGLRAVVILGVFAAVVAALGCGGVTLATVDAGGVDGGLIDAEVVDAVAVVDATPVDARVIDAGFDAAPSDNVLTEHDDGARTGQQTAETTLTVASLNAAHFGRAFNIPVDDDVYAQPLYVNGVDLGAAGVHNVLYIATMNDTIYAFDADTGATLWQTSFLGVDAFPLDSPADTGCTDISGHLGILATPAIDLGAGPRGTIYALAKTKDTAGVQHWDLHALDLTTGGEQPGSPANLEALAISVDGTGTGNDGAGHIPFDTTIENSRPGILVANGRVYVGFASLCTIGDYHGWLLAFDQHSLALDAVFNTTPAGARGGIWQGGDGPAVDAAGDLYLATGNGDFDGVQDFGDSVVKLAPDLTVLDYFAPYNQAALYAKDWDLGSGGVSIAPATRLVLQIGKTDTLRVLSADDLGHFNPAGDTQIVQEIELGDGQDISPADDHENFASPVYFTGAAGTMVYVEGAADAVHQFQLTGGQLVPIASSPDQAMWPGGGLTVSSNAGADGTGILWALTRGGLRAYDAADVSHELWTSTDDPDDDFGTYMWFSRPTVANGKVYVITRSNQVVVYAGR